MPLRLKLFLGIVLFFSVALAFFGYTAYDAAVQSGTARESAMLQNLSEGLSRDLRTDVGSAPDEAAIDGWLRQFESLDLEILITSSERVWLSDSARREVPPSVRHQIMTSTQPGRLSLEGVAFLWNTSAVADTPYSISVIHRTDVHTAGFFKRLIVPLIVAALIVLWVSTWSTMYIAALLEKLNAQRDELRHQAMHDALTNLPNRALMLERLQAAMQEADQSQTELALLFIDLNRFKEINDTLGHHYGDMLLVEMAHRLTAALRRVDTVARLGGDEFAIILSGVTKPDADAITAALMAVIGREVEIDGHKLFVSGSIGIARYPSQARNTEALVQCADIAMYAAKRAGTGYVFYDPSFDDRRNPRSGRTASGTRMPGEQLRLS